MSELIARSSSTSRLNAWAFALAALVVGVGGGLMASGLGAQKAVTLAVGVVVLAVVLWRYQIGVILILLTLPLDVYGRLITSPVTVTVFHVALLFTLVSWGIAVMQERAKLRFSAVDAGIAAILFAAVWSFPQSLLPKQTLIAIVRLAFLWLFTLLYANAMSSRRVMNWVTGVLVGTGVGSAGVALAQYFVPGFTFGSTRQVNQGGGEWLTRVGAFFHDPNYLAGFLSVTLVMALALLVHSRKWWPAIAWAGAAGVLGVGVLVTFSRTGLVGVAGALLIVLLTAPKDRRNWLIGVFVVLVLIAVVASPQAIVGRAKSIGDISGDLSIATRYHMFGSAFEIARDHWAVGTGLAAFEAAYPPYRRLGTLTWITKPHEVPIALVAETGVAGVIAQIVFLGALFVTFRRKRKGDWTAAEAFALAGLVGIMIQSLFQYYLYFEYLWLLIAFAVAANRVAAEEESHEFVA